MPVLRELSPEESSRAYKTVFMEAFPPEELKPLESIQAMTRGGFYKSCGLFEGSEPLAYACLWWDGDYILIDYLCVPAEKRCGGFGSLLLDMLRQSLPDSSVLIAEVEAPVGDEKTDRMIYRRLGFYERSGARLMGYDCALFGVHYKTVVWSKIPVDEDMVLRRHDGLYRRWFSPEMYAAAIQIPLGPGEKPFDRKVWDERPESEETK